MGNIILGNHQQSGSIFINSVDDARPLYAVNIRKIFAVKQQGIDKGSRIVPVGRVYHHAPRFIDDNNIPVLINNVQGDIFRRYRELFCFGNRDFN